MTEIELLVTRRLADGDSPDSIREEVRHVLALYEGYEDWALPMLAASSLAGETAEE